MTLKMLDNKNSAMFFTNCAFSNLKILLTIFDYVRKLLNLGFQLQWKCRKIFEQFYHFAIVS